MAKKFDLKDEVVVIIGSGAGGGTLGNELAQKGIDVIIQLGTTFLDDPNTGVALPSTTTTTTVP